MYKTVLYLIITFTKVGLRGVSIHAIKAANAPALHHREFDMRLSVTDHRRLTRRAIEFRRKQWLRMSFFATGWCPQKANFSNRSPLRIGTRASDLGLCTDKHPI